MKSNLNVQDQPSTRRRQLPVGPAVLAAEAHHAEPSTPILRARIGRMALQYRTSRQLRSFPVTSSETLVHVLAPLRGGLRVTGEDGVRTIAMGEALLVGRTDRLICEWQGDAAALVLAIPRQSLQIAAFGLLRQARRLAAVNLVVDWDWTLAGSRDAAQDYEAFTRALLDLDGAEAEGLIARTLVASLVKAHGRDSALPTARSVQRALDSIANAPDLAWSVEQLAGMAGVTTAVLSRNFRLCVGVTVAQISRDARLDWLRGQLRSAHESRSIGQLAVAAGYATAGQLARAYQRQFGETPTQTRAQAFASTRR